MTLLKIFGLATAMFMLAVTPGPGVLATVSKALVSGFKYAVPVILGIVVGDLLFLLSAIYGLSLIAEAFGALFTVIKYLGSGYLIWVGIRLWRSLPAHVDGAKSAHMSGKLGFLGGLSITLGNPKVILFYLCFLPTFIELDTLSSVDIALVALIVSSVLASVLLSYAYAASRARKLLTSEKASRNVNRVAGSVMIGTGAVLLSKS